MPAKLPRRLRVLFEPLTPREKQVLGMILDAKGNKEIAAALRISVWTTQFHSSNLLRKLGASDRTELLARIACGLLRVRGKGGTASTKPLPFGVTAIA